LAEQSFRKLFIFLDTDKHASPFDIITALDLFPDSRILKYENVTPEDSEKIVYDAMFPRGPEGAKHTKIFINGHDSELVSDILERVKKCMFPPFELAVIVDPRGAYTTASAAVAKTVALFVAKGFGSLENKTVTVLAGTGPVGQTAARLYASEQAEVLLTSRSLQKAVSAAAKITEDLESEKVIGVEAQTPEDVGKAIKDSDIVLSAGAAATELLTLQTLKEYDKKCRIVADINAVPPLGVQGLDSNDDGREIIPGIFGVGALAIGKLKNKTEAALIRMAAEAPKGLFSYKEAYDIAKKTLLEKPKEKKTIVAEPTKYWLP
jgi:hypothetical protein